MRSSHRSGGEPDANPGAHRSDAACPRGICRTPAFPLHGTPGDRKSVQPMAKRLVLGEYDQLHHFIAAGVWEASPVETELLVQADRLVGGPDAGLGVADTALPQKGPHSGGGATRNASGVGKGAQ